MSHNDLAKIVFNLTRDSEGWPPADVETMWAAPLGPNQFRIDNIPFYALGVSDQDVVVAIPDDDGRLIFREVAVPSEFSTVRLFVSEGEDKEAIRSEFKKIDCDSEGINDRLFALSIPSHRLESVMRTIRSGEADGRWDWEEGVIK